MFVPSNKDISALRAVENVDFTDFKGNCMIRRLPSVLLKLCWVVLIVACHSGVPVASAAPVIFYSDLDSSPPGAYVTIWGKGFGSELGHLEVGAAKADDILSWTDNMVEFRVPENGGSGIRLRSGNDEASNQLPFVTRPTGKIYFVSAEHGDNKFNGMSDTHQGGKDGPWRDLHATKKLAPGDVVYVRDGIYDEVLDAGSRPPRRQGGQRPPDRRGDPGMRNEPGAGYQNAPPRQDPRAYPYGDGPRPDLRQSGEEREAPPPDETAGEHSAPQDGEPERRLSRNSTHFQVTRGLSGSSDKPVAVVAYPGESPVIGGSQAARAVFFQSGVKHFTLAKFRLVARDMALGMGHGPDFFGIRIVGNIASGIQSPMGTLTIQSCTDCKILGNHISDSGLPRNKFSQLIYYGGFGVGANVEIAWNLLHDQPGGRAIQFFGHTSQDKLSGVSVHDNVIFNCARDGILIGASDGPVKDWISDALIYNNVVYNVGGAGIRIASPGVDAKVLHNTLTNNRMGLLLHGAKQVAVHNNIFSGDGTHVMIGSPPRRPREGQHPRANQGQQQIPERKPMDPKVAKISHNGYDGAGAAEQDMHPIEGDAEFSDPAAGDFSLRVDSPFRRAGMAVTPSLPAVSVPQTESPDLGASGWPLFIQPPAVASLSGAANRSYPPSDE